LVDVERIRERLELLDTLLPVLEQTSAGGEHTYIAEDNDQARLATERALQVALQICIDIGAHLISELGLRRPDDYRGVFKSLADGTVIPRDLADRLGDAAGLRNVLVHDYVDVDDHKVFEALDQLDDLRAFAAAALEAAEREGDTPAPD
jgi:uncharacterized protein YutE (UPF0331/DUF86 family)